MAPGTRSNGYKFIGDVILNSKNPPLITTEESYGSSLCPTISLDKDAMQLLPIVAEAAQYLLNHLLINQDSF